MHFIKGIKNQSLCFVHSHFVMRLVLYIALMLFVSIDLDAQDTLYKVDGSKKIVKIMEVSQTVVRYKLSTNPDGPIYAITVEDVIKIVYENGSTTMFYKGASKPIPVPEVPIKKAPVQVIPLPQKPPKKIVIGPNIISINMLPLFTSSLAFGYERILKSGNNSVKIPISIGFNTNAVPDTNSNYYNYKLFSVGFDFYKYPHRKAQAKAKYFYGPSIEYGQFNFLNYTDINVPPDNPNDLKDKSSYFAIAFQNGFLYHPANHFALSITLGLSYFKPLNEDYYDVSGYLVIKGGLNVGYNF
jgi:hypothetical protein